MRSWLEVLIVSGNHARSQDLAQFITQAGAEAHSCSSIGEAQRILQGYPICMVFSDHTFHDGDFRDIIAILASLGTRIPVAVYSPLKGRKKRMATLQKGTCLTNSFPYSKEEVERLIAALVAPGDGLMN
jgi:DNA-binding NtrC family response regulator